MQRLLQPKKSLLYWRKQEHPRQQQSRSIRLRQECLHLKSRPKRQRQERLQQKSRPKQAGQAHLRRKKTKKLPALPVLKRQRQQRLPPNRRHPQETFIKSVSSGAPVTMKCADGTIPAHWTKKEKSSQIPEQVSERILFSGRRARLKLQKSSIQTARLSSRSIRTGSTWALQAARAPVE